jgi:DNA-binding phage protein
MPFLCPSNFALQKKFALYNMEINISIKEKYRALQEHMDERTRRICAAAEAQTIGRDGISIISRETGLARTVIYSGLYELDHPGEVPVDRIRKA